MHRGVLAWLEGLRRPRSTDVRREWRVADRRDVSVRLLRRIVCWFMRAVFIEVREQATTDMRRQRRLAELGLCVSVRLHGRRVHWDLHSDIHEVRRPRRSDLRCIGHVGHDKHVSVCMQQRKLHRSVHAGFDEVCGARRANVQWCRGLDNDTDMLVLMHWVWRLHG